MSFFAGNIAFVYNANIAIDILMSDPSVIIFSLDEDNEIPQLDPELPRVTMGTMLLPPIESLWVRDTDFERFQQEYYMYLTNPERTEYIFMMLGLIYRGYKIVLYYPDETDETIQYLKAFWMSNYGIHICEPSKQYDLFGYDQNKVPMYACGMYYSGMLSPNEFLLIYPINLVIPNDIYIKLIQDIQPYGSNMIEKIKMIDSLHAGISRSNNINLEIPFIGD